MSKTWSDVGKEIDPHHEVKVPHQNIADGYPANYSREKKQGARFTDEHLRRLARDLQAAEEAGYVMRKRWHCSDYRHNHRRKIGAWLCVLLKG